MKPVTAVLVGAGQRGEYVYGSYARQHPDTLRFVAIAEPLAARRMRFAADHDIPPERQFTSWEECAANEPEAEAWVVATDDRDHLGPAQAALASGRAVLVEKPMAATLAEASELVRAAAAPGALVHVAHVLRYTPFFRALNHAIRSGRLGDIVTVEHRENVSYWHMAHTFVRGRSARLEASTPMIVQKCCHDFDILHWNLAAPVRRLSSIGSLLHFRPENAPEGAPDRCTDGCPAASECPYEAQRIYLNEGWKGWPVHVITDDLSREGRLHALRTGPYGRCAYRCDSDVVDHQTVSMELESGASVVLVTHGHAADEARTMRYDGTRATLRAIFGRTKAIEITEHGTGRREEVPIPPATGGHGGGDPAMIDAFVAAVRGEAPSPTSAAESLESHLLAFAAEQARTSGAYVDVAGLRATLR